MDYFNFQQGIMGNEQVQSKQRIITHPVLRNSQLQLDKGVIKTFVPVVDEADLGDWVQNIHRVKNFESEFLFNPEKYSIQNRSMCGNSCLVKLTYPVYPYLLIDQIVNRRHIKRSFEENELWYILYALSECSNHFLDTEDNLGDIRPHNILFNQIGELKVIHRFSWPGEVSNFEKTRFDNKVTYLAPEEVNLLCAGKTYNSSNKTKAESFSVGLTLLSALYLKDFSDIYDATYMNIDLEQFRQFYQKMDQRTYVDQSSGRTLHYSSQLLKLIHRLCDPDHDNRLSIVEVYRWLLPYQKEIIGFQEFRLRILDGPAKESLSYNKDANSLYSQGLSEVNKLSQVKMNTQKIVKDLKISRRPSRSNTMNFMPIRMEDLSPSGEPSSPSPAPSNQSPFLKILPLQHHDSSSRFSQQSQYLQPQSSQKQITQPRSENANHQTYHMTKEQYSAAEPQRAQRASSVSNNSESKHPPIRIQDLQRRPPALLKDTLVPIIPVKKQMLGDVNMISTFSKYPDDEELLKKIEEQLERSRRMFPS